MDGPSGPSPLPPRQSWPPPAPAVPEVPAVPVVPDSWFAEPIGDRPSGAFPQIQTGPFTPVFDDGRAGPGFPEPPAAEPRLDSTFGGMSAPEPFPSAQPGALAFEPTYAQPEAPASEPPYAQPGALASEPPYPQPGAPASEPTYAQPGALASEPTYMQPGVSASEPTYVQPGVSASEPTYVQVNGFAPAPPYAQANGHPYGQPQQMFAPVPGAPHGAESPWEPSRAEKPLWDPDGPLPMTRSHRVPTPGGGGRGNKPLLIGVASLVVLAMVSVGFVLLSGGDDEKKTARPETSTSVAQPAAGPADPTAARQAKKVQALLNASAKSRAALSDALVRARKCASIPASIATMEQVAQQRQAQWKQARELNIPKLPEAVKMRGALARSIKLSLDVDTAYLAWARSNQGCKGRTPLKGANYKRGSTLSAQASRAKNRFLGMWNQVAPQYGLAKRQSY